MNIKEIKKLLKPYGLKLTLCRFKLFEIFLSKDRAITYTEILQLTEHSIDRVTVYRTLKAFEDLGVIHRVIATDGSSNYALSQADNKTNANQHLHFNCIKCHGVFCLDDQQVPAVSLPAAYEVHALTMTVVGICKKCSCK
jgi:Fur family ferric uptake transcriptional regulator